MSRPLCFFIALLLSSLIAAGASAHHSFAVYYDSKRTISITGTVESFRFTNPHGILKLQVTNEEGKVENWTVETTAPVYMARRGWSKDTIKPGETVRVEGWPSRDGSHLMRIRAVYRPDGSRVGGTSEASDN